MAVQAVDGAWWQASLDEVGVKSMERTLSKNADWEEVLRSGREELATASVVSGMSLNHDRKVLDLGCGVGRVTFALADKFQQVVGADISVPLIEQARRWNRQHHVQFVTIGSTGLEPQAANEYDTVFANEVLYLLKRETVESYFRDAYRLLKSGGEFVFQLNMESIFPITRLSWKFRSVLHSCGIKSWRGWPTGAGFSRQYHRIETVRESLTNIGFRVERISVGRSLRQTWFVAVKP